MSHFHFKSYLAFSSNPPQQSAITHWSNNPRMKGIPTMDLILLNNHLGLRYKPKQCMKKLSPSISYPLERPVILIKSVQSTQICPKNLLVTSTSLSSSYYIMHKNHPHLLTILPSTAYIIPPCPCLAQIYHTFNHIKWLGLKESGKMIFIYKVFMHMHAHAPSLNSTQIHYYHAFLLYPLISSSLLITAASTNCDLLGLAV